MAHRHFSDKQYAMVKGLCWIYCRVAVGAAGAVTLQKWTHRSLGVGGNAYSAAPTTGGGTSYPLQYVVGADGVKSVARTGAGLWTVTLQDNYLRLIGMSCFSSLAGGTSAILVAHENTTISSMGATGGSVIGVALLSATATALDPASGESVNLCFHLQNLSEP